MRVSIAIRALNEEAEIGRCLSALSEQDIKPNQVMVIDNGSTDKTVEIAETYRVVLPIEIINNPVRGYSSGLNMGAEHASGDYLVYLSADCRPSRSWLKELLDVASSTRATVVQGLEILPINGNMVHEVLSGESTTSTERFNKIAYFNNTNTLYNLEVLNRYLPFIGQKGGEDTLMSIIYQKNNHLAVKSNLATVEHNKFPTTNDFKKHMRQHGAAARELMMKQPLKPRLYINSFYWGVKEILLGVTKRSSKHLKVGAYRIYYSSLGMLGAK